ncbi:MAG: rhomboid family intramembrane serine protease [Nitrososphaerales archaeon]
MYASKPKFTFIFILFILAFFIYQNISDAWINLAFFPAFAFTEPWTFITSVFLHADFIHLFFNIFALFFFGIYLERIIGNGAFAALFFVSGVVGNLGYLITSSNPYIPAIGASGAIYGVIGTLAVLAPSLLVYIYGFIPVPMALAAVIWALIDLGGLFVPSGIAHGAHLGGMLVGLLYGAYLRIRVRRG